jgi:hypothetical protein
MKIAASVFCIGLGIIASSAFCCEGAGAHRPELAQAVVAPMPTPSPRHAHHMRSSPSLAQPPPAPPPIPAAASGLPATYFDELRTVSEKQKLAPAGFGRYSYIFLRFGSDERIARDVAFVSGIGAVTDDDAGTFDPRKINVFVLPFHDTPRQPLHNGEKRARWIVKTAYDRGLADQMLYDICGHQRSPQFCKNRSLRGPFLLVTGTPLMLGHDLPVPLVAVDMSGANEKLFPRYIADLREFQRSSLTHSVDKNFVLDDVLSLAKDLDDIGPKIASILSPGE